MNDIVTFPSRPDGGASWAAARRVMARIGIRRRPHASNDAGGGAARSGDAGHGRPGPGARQAPDAPWKRFAKDRKAA